MNMNAAAAMLDSDQPREYSGTVDKERQQEERILLEQIRSGHPTAFEQLVVAQTPRMVNLAYRLVGNREEAEDIVQEGLLAELVCRIFIGSAGGERPLQPAPR